MLLDLLANQPPDFFHDPFGQFIINVAVAVIVGILTALVAIWIFRKQRTRKEISYQVISNAPIASVNKGLENRVTIHLDGVPVDNARQVVLNISNTGNAAVKRDDYDDPIRLVFVGSDIIGSDIFSTEPENLIYSIDKNTFTKVELVDNGVESIELENILLNPKQTITLAILLTDDYSKLDVRGRIVEGKIVEERSKQYYIRRLILISAVSVLFGVSSILLSFANNLLTNNPPNPVGTLLLAIAGFIYILCVVITIFVLSRRSFNSVQKN